MKFIFITPHLQASGGIITIIRLAESVMALGHRVILATPARIQCGWTRFQVQTAQIPNYQPRDFRDADWVITFGDTPPNTILKWQSKYGKPLLFIQGLHIPEVEIPNIRSGFYAICTTSRWLTDEVRELAPNRKVIEIGFGIEHELFYPDTAPPSGNLVGMIYHPHWVKGMPIGFSAFRLVQQMRPDLNLGLLLLGTNLNGVPHDFQAQLVTNPPRQDIRRSYAACRVWLVPSIYEGLGMPILEAQACGVPVISTDHMGAREFPPESLTVVPICDAGRMAMKIIHLIENQTDRQRQIRAGLQFAAQCTFECMARRLVEGLGNLK